MKTKFILAASLLMLSFCLYAQTNNTSKLANIPSRDLYVAAYIWPSCHDDPLARKWIWTEGIGEWEVIKKGNPRFEGHYQPKQPLWGYEMDNDPQVVEKWINTALEYGVNTFIYDWYWYKDPDGYNGPYLESALDDGFLGAPSNTKMNFYIMWANHDVKYNYWNCHKWGDNTDILFDPKVNWNEFPQIVDRIISKYFLRPNYLKIDGKPVFAIYNFDNLIKGFGSLEETQKALAYLEEKVKAAGFPGIHIQESFGGGPRLNEKNTPVYRSHVDLYGVDSFAFYNMGGFDTDYIRHCDNAVTIREQWDKAFDIPVFPCVSVAWDDTPRFPAKGKEKVTCFHDTPQVFGNYFSKALEYVNAHPEQPPIVMINAWNEWVEGSYLLPDMVNGFGYLEAVQKALDKRDQPMIESQWNGARVAFLGDSITDKGQLASQDIYWNQLSTILGIQAYCYGISGHRTSHVRDQAEKLLSEHGQDVDAIMIFIGTNDFNSNIPIGEWFTEEKTKTIKNGKTVTLKHRTPVMNEETVRSEINGFMSFLKHEYPTKQIILLTPIHRAYFNCSDNNIQPDENYANSLGLYIEDYVNVIKETANVWAVPVIDLNSICGLYPLERAHIRYFREASKDPDGVRHDLLHPNTEGQMRMALSIAYQLLGYPSGF